MTKYLTQIKNPADASDPYIIKDLNAEIRVGQVVGKMYRSNVGGAGSFTISGNSGIIPDLTAGTYTVHIYARSTTLSYTFRFNFGTSVTYDLSTTNGILSDIRTITISAGTFSGSVIAPSGGGVASGTHLYVVMYSNTIPIKGVGPAAVTNNYVDLDNKPTIPAAANNGTLTLIGQYSGTSGSTSDSSGNSLFTANASSGTTLTITGNATDSGIKTYRDGNIVYIKHTNSVTAGTDVGKNTTTSLSHGGTFIVPYLSYDANGHITGSSTTTLTLPSNTDEKVKQTASTSNSKHPLLASSVISTVIGTGTTDESIYCEGINIEPSMHTISIESGDSTYSALLELSSGDVKTYVNVGGNTAYSSELNPIGFNIDNDVDKFYISASGQNNEILVQTKNSTTDNIELETYISAAEIDAIQYDTDGSTILSMSSITENGITTPALTITSLGTTSPQMLVVGTDGTVSSQTIPTNTDEKVTDAAGTGKAYLLGHTTQATNATAISNANVYMQNGRLTTSNLSITSLGTSTPKMLTVGSGGTVSSQAIPADTLQQINSATPKGKTFKSFMVTGVVIPDKNGIDWDNPIEGNYGDSFPGVATDTIGLGNTQYAVWVKADSNNSTTPVILNSPNLALTNIQSGTPVTSGYLALDSNNNVIKTSGGGGSTVTGKTVTLSTTAQAAIQVNGTDSGSINLPTNPPTSWLGTSSTKAAAGDHEHTLSVFTQSGNLTVTNNQYYKRDITANTTINVSPSSTIGSLCYLLIYNSSSSADYTVTFNAASGTLLGSGGYKILRGTRMEFSFVTTTASETVMTYTTLR